MVNQKSEELFFPEIKAFQDRHPRRSWNPPKSWELKNGVHWKILHVNFSEFWHCPLYRVLSRFVNFTHFCPIYRHSQKRVLESPANRE